MNWTIVRYFAFVTWCVSAMGCTICQNARRTLWQEPAAYSWKHDRRRSTEAYMQWANAELAEEASRCPDLFGDPAYIMGFRDGFVDFVWAGGTGEPPPVPPRQYWNVMLRSPDGKARANLWFDGYRHGTAVARDGGYRDLGTVESSLVRFTNRGEPLTYLPDMYGMPASDATQPWQEGEVLPEPPGTAPMLPSPFENNSAPEVDSAAEPAMESDAPAVEETPFQDDPQPRQAESEDQPLSMSAVTRETHVSPQHEATAKNETSLQELETDEFDVQPAILLKVELDNGSKIESDSTDNHPVSTVKFVVEASNSETKSTFFFGGQESVEQDSGSNLESNAAGNHPLSATQFGVEASESDPKLTVPFRGQESQRQPGAATAARRALQRLNFGGWTRSGTATSVSNSQLRVLDE